MQLKDKYAIAYGAAGAAGSAVARAFAREGATVFLTGRALRLIVNGRFWGTMLCTTRLGASLERAEASPRAGGYM